MFSKTDLWVVPQASQSAWLGRLDWYLNWQLCKGSAHVPQRPSAEMLRLAKAYDIPIPDLEVTEVAPLMVACEDLVPARTCLLMPYSGQLKVWLKQISTIANGLGVRSLDVFLPTGTTVANAEKAWSSLDAQQEAQFIADYEETK